jgi:hypothetical protein
MAATRWKVYRNKEHIASVKYVEDAAVFMIHGDMLLDGDWPGRPVVWREGAEEITCQDSADRCAAIVYQRAEDRLIAYKKTCVPTRLGDAFGR